MAIMETKKMRTRNSSCFLNNMIKSFFVYLSLVLPLSTFANQFNQFVILPNNDIYNNENYAGIIYYEKSISLNPEIICTQKKKLPNLLHMIDQEGGTVVRIKGESVSPPSPSITNKMDINKFSKKMNNVAINLKKYCINVNLAPVADTNYVNRIESRAYDTNPNIVKEYAQQFATAMRNQGIVPTWKHFPGYSLNADEPSIDDEKSINEFEVGYTELIVDRSQKKEIYSNMEAFKNNHYDLLMLNIGVFPAISSKPILLNKDIIKKAHQLQPNSLLMTDDISFLKLNDERTLYLFKHVDLFLFSSLKNADRFIEKLNLLYSRGLIKDYEINAKINRINHWKQQQK